MLRTNTRRKWGRVYLGCGLGGMLLLYSVGLIPAVQRFLSATETGVFNHLNQLLGRNPVWDWTFLVTASDFWINFAYAISFFVLLAYGWRKRREDYGQVFGYIVFAAVVVLATEELADFIAVNLHRMLPWKEGVAARIKETYSADFFDMHRDEGIVDDMASAMSCLYFLVAARSFKTSLVSLGVLLAYMFSSILVGTQWLTVQAASVLMGAFFAGMALVYAEGLLVYMEKKVSRTVVPLFGRFMLSRGIMETNTAQDRQFVHPRMLRQIRRRNIRLKNRFWERTVKPQALVLLQGDPATAELYTSSDMTMARVRSTNRVRFLRLNDGETFVLRAIHCRGGIFYRSPRFERFTSSMKNNIYLHRLGFPVPKVIWTREGISGFGLFSYFFGIEEYLENCHDLQADSVQEVERAMRLLARLHQHSASSWGGPYEQQFRLRRDYIFERMRGEVLYELRLLNNRMKFRLSEQDINAIWKRYEEEAVALFGSSTPPFRLVHGDVSPWNFRATEDSQIRMIDFVTVQYDLAGCEIMKSPVSFTRKCPKNCALAWEAYFKAAGLERWTEFVQGSRLAFARYALRELSHGRAMLQQTDVDCFQAWLDEVFDASPRIWGVEPNETDWPAVFAILGIHNKVVPQAPPKIEKREVSRRIPHRA